jgi:hypothetical protein
LQIIKPRLTGTVEFRGDPCEPDVQSIMRMAAVRLGFARYFRMQKLQQKQNFHQLVKENDFLFGKVIYNKYILDDELIPERNQNDDAMIRKGLALLDNGEAKFLND